ncbi:hypothetical protein BS78_01G060400 [Paspalum vaginatum]|nr:hypothetical protein BS78_01G060400 [Paspalum vaginatum]
MMMFFDLASFGNLVYYVLYDAFDSSLAMIPIPPELHLSPASGSIRPLTLPRDRSDGAGGYEMAVMSREIVPPGEEGGDHTYDGVLYTWTPSATVLPPVCTWQVSGRPVFPQIVKDEAFFVECMFCFQGKLFFGDLTLGLVCCDLPTSTSNSKNAISLYFIPLPPGVYATLRWETNNLEDTDWMDRNRTIGCAQGLIKLVCIDRSAGRPADVKLSVWTLDVSIKQWNKDHEFRAVQLWKWFGFRKKGLPETPPKCPVLMPDGSITFLIPRLCMTEKDPIEDYICNVDLNRMKFGWSGEPDTCSYRTPIVVPGNFFAMVTPPLNVTVRTGIFI